MQFSKAPFILLFAALAFPGVRALSQAKVTENQTTYIYVDAEKGADGNVGSASWPFKTIQAAVNKADLNNQKSVGTKVIINAGVYRETVNIAPISGQTSATMTIEAATAGTAIIAGSEVLTGWSLQSEKPVIYERTWPYYLGACALPYDWPTTFAPIALQPEMIFVNNIPLTQVMAYAQLIPGTFYVNQADGLVHIAPAPSTDMATAIVEAAVRPEILNVQGRSNLVLRGLVLRHAASCMNLSGSNVIGNSNILIDHVQAVWNNWGGLNVSSNADITVQDSIASHNGGMGLSGNQDINALFASNESDYNNWRGAMAAFYDWGMGGTKLMMMRNASVQYHHSYGNQAQGLWFDTDNKEVAINKATLSGNVLTSLQIERNEGPISITDSTLCSSGAGVTINNSEKLTIENNVFYNNSGTNKYQAEVFIGGAPGGKPTTDWQTGQTYDLFTTGTVMSGNTFEDASPGQNVFGTFLTGADWSDFAYTLNSNNNRWYDPVTASSYKIVDGKLVTLTGWRTATGADTDSEWALPATSPIAVCALPAPSYPDFSVNLDSDGYTMVSAQAVATARVNSYAFGAISLSVTGLPAGVTATLSRQSLVSGIVTLKLTASKAAKNQNIPITLWGYGDNRVHSVTFYVHVIPPTT
jgi:hypothetical protein